MPNNILLFLSDDQPYKMWPYSPEARRLVQIPGTFFTAARCNYSLCQPCRIGLLSGMLYKRHGVGGNGSTGSFDHNNSLGKWIHDAGYRTAHIGKYMNAQTTTGIAYPAPTGWDFWRMILQPTGSTDEGQDAWAYNVTEDTTYVASTGKHSSDYIREQTTNFVAGSEPWFAVVCPMSPHYPFQPLPADTFAYSDVNWPIVLEHNPTNKPSWIQSAPDVSDTTIGTFQSTARGQLREMKNVDALIKGVVESLSPAVLARTNILYASDNGLYYGEHRNPANGVAKVDLYECAAHVPVWGKGPGFPANTINTVPVIVAQDLTATCVAIAGASAPWAIDGIDLRNVATNPSSYSTRAILQQRAGGPGAFNLSTLQANGICTTTRKFIQYEVGGATPDTSPDRWELFDLVNDPEELDNKAYAGGSWLTERNALKAIFDTMWP